MEKTNSRVCVTGGGGYIGSWLVRELLKKGYIVHTTLRNIGDESKTGLLNSFDGAPERLKLFEADLYDAESFEAAIDGCFCIFLVATPLQHNTSSSQYKSTTEASVSAAHIIMRACEKSRAVTRVIYTGTVTSASPLKEDGSGFKRSMDESCWTPLDLPYAHREALEQDYLHSKTQTEKELLLYNNNNPTEKGHTKIQVVSLLCGLVGGGTLQPYVHGSLSVILSPLTFEKVAHRQLKFLQSLLGSVPLVHIEDVCQAHIFCMEKASISGRFLCAGTYPTMHEIVTFYEHKYPNTVVLKEVVGEKTGISCSSTKLVDIGFEFKNNTEQILVDSVERAISLGVLKGIGE